MTTTLPGGLWYPERETILDLGAISAVAVAPGDAIGAEFALGAVSCMGAAFGLKFGATGDFRIDLLDPDDTVLRTVDWPGTRTGQSAFTYWVVCPEWAPVELADDVTYRLLCTATGAGTVTVGDALLASFPTALGHRIRRVGGVWTDAPTRRCYAALHLQAL
jgi:hypothetical protein